MLIFRKKQMEDQLIEQKLQEALTLCEQGMSYLQIRQHFQQELSEENISYLIRLVDEFVIEEDRIRAEIKNRNSKFISGWLVWHFPLC
ncbi:MAG: hypothetical protein HC819_04430 [Cyclobacteriaceae bacterium]|nr:hypothetical protein [Cyclobacteriaceae bacterium]